MYQNGTYTKSIQYWRIKDLTRLINFIHCLPNLDLSMAGVQYLKYLKENMNYSTKPFNANPVIY